MSGRLWGIAARWPFLRDFAQTMTSDTARWARQKPLYGFLCDSLRHPALYLSSALSRMSDHLHPNVLAQNIEFGDENSDGLKLSMRLTKDETWEVGTSNLSSTHLLPLASLPYLPSLVPCIATLYPSSLSLPITHLSAFSHPCGTAGGVWCPPHVATQQVGDGLPDPRLVHPHGGMQQCLLAHRSLVRRISIP